MALPNSGLALLLLLLLLPLLGFLLAVISKNQKREEDGRNPKHASGPTRLPVIGNLHQLGEVLHQALFQLAKRHGPLMRLQLGRVPAVVVSSAPMAEQVLKVYDLHLCRRPAMFAFKRISYDFSDVILSPCTATWREMRKIMVLKLLSPQSVTSFRAMREEEVDRMIESISDFSSLSKPVNLSLLLNSLSFSLISKAVFGKGSHGEGLEEDQNEVQRIFRETIAMSSEFFVADYFPWAGWLDVLTGKRSRLEKVSLKLDDFVQRVIVAHQQMHAGPNEEAKEEDIVDVLLRLHGERHLTLDNVKASILNIFVAGSDSTSATVQFAMAELMRHPRVMLKAQEEVRRVVGVKGRVEENDLFLLGYLELVVKETLRLHPPAPLLVPREAMDHVEIAGCNILPGTRVIVNVFAIGRDPDFWDNPEEFIPERFAGSTVNFTGHHFQFLPFGSGRRMCPGMELGIVSVKLALANLLYAFDWALPVDRKERDIDMDETLGIAIKLKTDLQLQATKHVLPR